MAPLEPVSRVPAAEEREFLETADDGLQGLDEKRQTAKESSPAFRNLNILDLPDELLFGIFESLENSRLIYPFQQTAWLSTDDGLPQHRQDIQNTRLVCRRFCAISSQLLVRFVRVDLNESSLARLDEISRHPTIAKGVRVVKVVLHFYNRRFEDRNAFIAFYADRLAEKVGLFNALQKWKTDGVSGLGGAKISAELESIIDDLKWLIAGGPSEDTKDDRACRVRVEQIHGEHLVLLKEQQLLVQSRKFSEVLGSAIARMPGARCLGLVDACVAAQGQHGLLTHGADLWAELRHVMLQPMGCYEAKRHDLELPDYQCIAGMIDAVRSAGAMLNTLEIYLTTCPGQSGSLVLPPDMREAFSSGLRQLKEFTFTCGSNIDEPNADDADRFLAACLETPNLQQLTLNLRPGMSGTRTIDAGKLLGTKSWPELTDLYLGRVDIDLSKLVLLLERLPEPMRCLELEDVTLRSGTWKDALDALRAKKSTAKSFYLPHGAECDDMLYDDYQRIFGQTGQNSYVSNAELYIRNSIFQTRNPLQLLEDRLAVEAEE